jgi:hypothetical protein
LGSDEDDDERQEVSVMEGTGGDASAGVATMMEPSMIADASTLARAAGRTTPPEGAAEVVVGDDLVDEDVDALLDASSSSGSADDDKGPDEPAAK